MTDPLVVLINEYEAAKAALIASPRDDDSKEEPFGEAYAALADSPPAATTLEGAVAAVRLVMHEEKTCGSQEEFTVTMLAAALAYFDGGAT
ncbi:hypothetical protein ABMA32_14020 [Mesorhizobium sp. VNQ89]|uniref:hypothetical protein n=1 Tax=Mesorhizobium quangtriensis TaxID=3157709 RepID=UPI0032B86A60